MEARIGQSMKAEGSTGTRTVSGPAPVFSVERQLMRAVALPLGDAAGGQGLLDPGAIPGLPGLPPPFALPGVEGLLFGVPAFGAVPDVPSGFAGKLPHGDPAGELPSGAFGFCEGVCGVAVPAGGVAVPAGGVAGLAGGVAVPAGGVTGEPGVELWPADPEAGGTPPAGAV